MWRPTSFEEAARAIGTVSEGPDLDFKREIGSPKEIAKDVTSMTVLGGVIVYGIDEQSGVATAITPVPLDGQRERIQQIVDTAIKPAPETEIEVLRGQQADTEGIIVVTVPASPLSPHYTHDRFPARSDTTTRYLAEAEIAALYEQRRVATGGRDAEPFDNAFVVPEGSTFPPGTGIRGIAMLRLLVEPLASGSQAPSPFLRRSLREAFLRAQSDLSQLVAPHLTPKTFDWLHDWDPRGTSGWRAGEATGDQARLADNFFVAATYTYPGRFSFLASFGLTTPDGVAIAYEHLWAAETMACLSLAGHFFATHGSPLLRAEIELFGLEGAVSYRARPGTVGGPAAPKIVDSQYFERTEASARELAADPRSATRALLGRLLASFRDETDDLVEELERGL